MVRFPVMTTPSTRMEVTLVAPCRNRLATEPVRNLCLLRTSWWVLDGLSWRLLVRAHAFMWANSSATRVADLLLVSLYVSKYLGNICYYGLGHFFKKYCVDLCVIQCTDFLFCSASVIQYTRSCMLWSGGAFLALRWPMCGQFEVFVALFWLSQRGGIFHSFIHSAISIAP